MSSLRFLATIAVCIGLVLPSAHSVALCLDREGNVSLEAAVNGACAGLDSRCCDGDTSRGEEPALDSCYADHCGGCRDVVIGGADIETPVPTHEKAPQSSRPSTDVALAAEEELSTRSDQDGPPCQAFFTHAAERSPPRTTSVLRL
jgi:hypothetical protein